MRYDLLVKSSDGETTYVVQFIIEAEKLSIFCACPAGEFGKICKHKLALLNGDRTMLVVDGSSGGFDDVQEWIKQSEWRALLNSFNESEERVKVAQTDLAKLKKRIEAAMKNGL